MIKPDDGYVTYIINPKSGSSSSTSVVHDFRTYLEKSGYKVRVQLTESLEHAKELATAAAVSYDCSLVIGSGGDGTIREIIEGMEGCSKPLMIIPGGTENLLANELGCDENLKTYIDAIEDGLIRKFDVGVANGRCFTSILGVGFDGDVVHDFSAKRKGHISHMDYFWPIWRNFWSHDFPNLKMVIDDSEVIQGHGMLFVGNISRYAMGLEILKKADYGDGMLDMCFYKCSSIPKLLLLSGMTAIKKHTISDNVIYRQCKKIEISSDRDVYTQIDGDPGPGLSMDVQIIPDSVNVIVPKYAKPAGIRTRIKRVLGF